MSNALWRSRTAARCKLWLDARRLSPHWNHCNWTLPYLSLCDYLSSGLVGRLEFGGGYRGTLPNSKPDCLPFSSRRNRVYFYPSYAYRVMVWPDIYPLHTHAPESDLLVRKTKVMSAKAPSNQTKRAGRSFSLKESSRIIKPCYHVCAPGCFFTRVALVSLPFFGSLLEIRSLIR